MKIITRKEAFKNGLKRYFTNKPCKHGHIAERMVKNCECYECRLIAGKAYKKLKYHNNPELAMKKSKEFYKKNKTVIKKYKQNWYIENKENILINRKTYYEDNKEIITIKNIKWKNKNKNKMKLWHKEYQLNLNKKPEQKIINFMRASLRRIVNKIKENKEIETINSLEYSIKDFKLYIEKQFDIFMTWENYGLWHIDHIIPLSYLVKLNEGKEQIEILNIVNSLDNLQPLWAIENIKKGGKHG